MKTGNYKTCNHCLNIVKKKGVKVNFEKRLGIFEKEPVYYHTSCWGRIQHRYYRGWND